MRKRLLAGVTALLLVLGAGVMTQDVQETSASWSSTNTAGSSFQAVQLGPVRNLQCADSKNPLLGIVPPESSITLFWDRPTGTDEVPLEYIVHWKRPALLGLLGAEEKTEVVNTPSYTYTTPDGLNLLDLLKLTIAIDVQPQIKGTSPTDPWTGPKSIEKHALMLRTGILSAYLGCS